MKKITNFNIDTKDLSTVTSIRNFTIVGEKDAEFMLQLYNSSGQFYNFNTESFAAGFNAENNLTVKMEGETYIDSVVFPANVNADTFSFLLLATPDKNTELQLGSGKNTHIKSILREANQALTFTPVSTSNSTFYQTFASTGAESKSETESPSLPVLATEVIDWDFKNSTTNSKGYGLRLIRQPIDTDWFFEKNLAILSNPAGDAVSNNVVTVASLTDIAVGMELIYHKGTTAPSATTVISNIDTSEKTITFSTNVAFEDGETMKFRAKGSDLINEAIGANIDFSHWREDVISATSAELTKTVRATGTNTVIALNNTHGISGGDHVIFKGLNVVNTSTNTIVSVVEDIDGSGEDGTITARVNQTAALTVGTKLYFDGSSASIAVKNKILIYSRPSAERIIYLELDNFITPGAIS